MEYVLSERAGYHEIHDVREDVEKAYGEEISHIAAKMAFNAQAREVVFDRNPYLHNGCVNLELFQMYMAWRHSPDQIEEAFSAIVDEGLLVSVS